MIDKVKKILANIEVYLMVALLCVFLVNVFLQIVTRLLGSPLSFTEEVSRYAFVWMVFLGMSYATKYDKHIRVDVFVTKLSAKIQLGIDIFINLIALAVFVWVLIYGLQYVEYSSISRTYALNINKGFVVIILPLSGLLMVYRVVEKTLKDIKKFKSIKNVGEA